jgi:hypothetical protein
MIRKGDTIQIKPEWQDAGDERFTWIAADDEQNGRVMITPIDTGLAIAPTQVVRVSMLVTA